MVALRWKPGTGDGEVAAIARALRALPDRIDSVRALTAGRDLGLHPDNADFAIVVDFDDEDGWQAYQDDPEHRRIVAEMIAPVLAQRTAIQVRHP